MPSLKSLRIRINSVKSTQKITKAMKTVAASKLRRAQDAAHAARPYAERMERMLASLATGLAGQENAPQLLAGTGRDKIHLLVVATADRGLCGAFNSSIARAARRKVQDLLQEGKTVKILCVGRKGRDMLRRDYADKIIDSTEAMQGRRLSFADAMIVTEKIVHLFKAGEFDVCTIFYNHFKSALSQVVTEQQLIPLSVPAGAGSSSDLSGAIYEFEPNEESILEKILPRNLTVQVYRAMLENAASEQGARMAAMDNATRNAGDMIKRLTLVYNRSRQAAITKELIEIISGAEAV